MILINQLYTGDCIEIMKKIPENSIGGCVTDPPYNYEFIGKNWNNAEIVRRIDRVRGESKTLVKNIPYGSGLAGGVRNKRWYQRNRENTLEYANWCRTWGQEIFRILKPGAIAMVFNSSRTVAQVQVALEDVGFYARDMIVWKRPSGIPKGYNALNQLKKKGYPNPEKWNGWHSCLRNEWEGICVVQKPLLNNYTNTIIKSGVGLFHAENEYTIGFQSNIIDNIKRDKIADFNTHCTVKPLELMKKLASLIMPENDSQILIDPFIGSGTTALACKILGIPYLGIDINPNYIEIARKRLLTLAQ